MPKSLKQQVGKNLVPFKDLMPACDWCNARRNSLKISDFREQLKRFVLTRPKWACAKPAQIIAQRGFKFYHEQPNAYIGSGLAT